MSNQVLLEVASATSNVAGNPYVMNGSRATVHVKADSYGTNGKVVFKASSDGINYTTLEDANTTSGLAEYSSDIIFNLDRLPIGWSLRADLEISSGTVTNLIVRMGT